MTRAQMAVIDELGEIEGRLADADDLLMIEAAKSQADRLRHAELEEIVLGWHAELDPEAEAVVEGRRYVVKVSRCEIRREIVAKFADLFKVLGKERFLGLVGITLGALKGEATAEQWKTWVKEERSGPRTLDVVAKSQLKKAA